jgi:hypothetical protein
MATITGQRLSNLATLAIGTTGTLFYAESASTNSFKMYEVGLYNTLYKLQLSGNFQPKNEDWRFVHTTGIETITGNKTFASQINTNYFVEQNGNLGTSTFIFMPSGWCISPGALTSLDWNNKILSGNWKNQTLQSSGIYGINITGGNIKTTYIRDTNNIISVDPNNRILSDEFVVDSIRWDSNRALYDASSITSIGWNSRYLFNSAGAASLGWHDKILSGNWKILGGLYMSGLSVGITGGGSSISNVSGSNVAITNGAEGGRLVGLNLGSTPKSVTLTVQSPIGGYVLFACVTGDITSDGFGYQLNAPTDASTYRLHYTIVL